MDDMSVDPLEPASVDNAPTRTPMSDQTDAAIQSEPVPTSTVPEDPSATEFGKQRMRVARLFRIIKDDAERNLVQARLYSQGDAMQAQGTVTPKKRKAWEMLDEIPEDMEDESDDDDDEEDIRHDPSNEPMPRVPTTHPAFTLAEKIGHEVAELLWAVMDKSGQTDPDLKNIQVELEKNQDPKYGTNLRVGLIGNSGVGKSSVANSSVGIENLSISADDGDSCTYVVIEFCYIAPMQDASYQAEIEFFCKEAGIQMVNQMFAHYVKNAMARDREAAQNNGDEYFEENDEEDGNAKTALQNFLSMFKDQSDFANEAAARAFLSKATSPTDYKLLHQLHTWTENIRRRFLPNDSDTVIIGSNDISDLVDKVLPFTRSVPYASFNDEPLGYSPWPLVNIIRIRLEHPLLKGLSLLDMPGVSDSNQWRVDATNRHLQKCDVSVVVSKIGGRPESDRPFEQFVKDAYRRRRSGSVILVATASDTVNMNNRTTFELSDVDKEMQTTLRTDVERTEEKLKDIKKRIKDAKGNSRLVAQLSKVKKRYERRKLGLNQDLTQLRIATRNDKIARSLAKQYEDWTHDTARVPIFCISNKVYMQYIAGDIQDNLPDMQLMETRVPLLRGHLFGLPATRKFATLEHHCRSTLPTILRSIRLFASVSKLKRKEDLQKIVTRARKDVRVRIDDLFDMFHSEVIGHLLTRIRECEGDWLKRAAVHCDSFVKTYKPATYGAYIRNFGKHKTRIHKLTVWNETLLHHVPEDLDPDFDGLCKERCQPFTTEIAQALSEIIEGISRTLANDPAAMLVGAVSIFLENLRTRKNEIRKETDDLMINLQNKFKSIHRQATTDGTDHYFTDAMIKVYDAANDVQAVRAIKAAPGRKAVRGKPKHLVRSETFKETVCTLDGPFHAIHEKVNTDITKTLDEERENLTKKVNSIFDKIQQDFDKVCSAPEDNTPEAKQFRELLLFMLDHAKDILDGPLKECLDLARKHK
ncbi:hypothetical protein BDV96DRAFT_52664 [Lophiotrema nucula]|uniref:P-loop containing nucleoside triphosphate hydrolase protein n=1 Tax=Lophiotrema nucula TaxID=690887 RepID=A0A6A5ZAG7_9PLEO|nr:hypothetical protein BDV96DRAFT_52664 [Lophiotrema nucula]